MPLPAGYNLDTPEAGGLPKGYTLDAPQSGGAVSDDLSQKIAAEIKKTPAKKTFGQQFQQSITPGKVTGPRSFINEMGKGTAAGLAGLLQNPLTTLKQTVQQTPPVMLEEMLRTGKPPEFATSAAQSIIQHPVYGISSILGPAAIAEGLGGAAGAAAKTVPEGVKVVAGAGKKATSDLVKDTRVTNAAEAAEAEAKNTAQEAERKGDLGKHFEKTQKAKEANVQAEAGPARKEALNRGVEQLDVKFQDELKQTAQDVKAQADAKYDTVRKATQGQVMGAAELQGAVRKAQGLIQGSSESLKIFNDILSKAPEEYVVSGGAKFGPGTPIYESVKATGEGLTSQNRPVTFADLQGYYSELGNKLSAGNLPGDVYLAMKDLRGSIDVYMQQMADRANVGGQLNDARNFYSQYMSAFRDHTSPLYKAINATERGKAIASLSGKDQTGIQTLARYSPDLARRANTIRGYQAEAKSISAKPKAIKSLPKLAEKPVAVVPGKRTIGAQDVRAAKEAGIGKRASLIEHRGVWAATWPLFHIMSSIMRGELGNIGTAAAEGMATYGAVRGVAEMLRNPKVVEFLSKATPKDIEQIPPDLRGDFPGIVQAAQKHGVKVSPALLAVTAGQAPKRVAAALDAGRDQFMASANPKGLIEKGNLPIWNRPTVQNSDGSHSSEYSTSFEDEKGREVLVPTVVNGKFLTPDGKKPEEGSAAEKAMFKAAWQHYLQTGENLGKFDNPDDADAYSQVLHNRGNP